MNVDWRNRFGRNWITSVRDQDGTENCWAFASTALYEAMVRIEHLLWTRRSEGDMVHGVGKQSWDMGNIGECTIFVERYGLADPDCFPFGVPAALYTAREGGSNLEATPLSPTPDRAGRTVRIAPGMTTTVTGAEAAVDRRHRPDGDHNHATGGLRLAARGDLHADHDHAWGPARAPYRGLQR